MTNVSTLRNLLSPDAAALALTERFTRRHRDWLAGEGTWPLTIALGTPTEREVASDGAAVRRWVEAWTAYGGNAEVVWEVRQFPRLGAQRLPSQIRLAAPADVARSVSATQAARWSTASRRYAQCLAAWPYLAASTVLRRNYDVLADYRADDFDRLVALIDWIHANPSSGYTLRQVPVEGLDTKWVEKRRGLVMDLLQGARPDPMERDFYAMCGLQRPPHRLRVRLLCPALRAVVGGLRDLEAPIADVAALPIAPAGVIIVENVDTGLALPDMPGCVAIMGLGNAVSVLARLPWLVGAAASPRAVYWGDLDTHGFAILDRARQAVPWLQSAFMDEATLLAHRRLAGREDIQCPANEMPNLTAGERDVYEGLRSHRWGDFLRLEQERLPLAPCVESLRATLSGCEPTQ